MSQKSKEKDRNLNFETELRKKNVELTELQHQRAAEYVIDILENLPEKAFNVLYNAFDSDIESMVKGIFNQTVLSLNLGASIDTERIEYVNDLAVAMDKRLKVLSYNYFKTTVLSASMEQGWRNLEWGNLIQLYPKSSFNAARGHGKSYEFVWAFALWRLFSYDMPIGMLGTSTDNKLRKETLIVTNTLTLAKDHVAKMVEEIRFNKTLSEKLNPNKKATLAALTIETETGSKIKIRGKDTFIRGLHVGASVMDDFPDDSSIYSKEQRDKTYNVFNTNVKPATEPGGYIIVSGTPYHTDDLYGRIKKDKSFKSFEYPCIYPDGTLLSPDRFTLKGLLEEKRSLGSLGFTREYMVVPVSDDSTIFPWEHLKMAFLGMENIRYVDSIRDYPIKLVRVVVGADFAKSGKVGADYTVYTVWGVDANGIYYLLHVWRKRGATYEEQVNQLISLNNRFNANQVICEDNGFQGIIADMLRARGVANVKTFTTTSKAKKGKDGLPSLDALFERGVIKMPYGNTESVELSEMVCSEFNSISYRPDSGKLESTTEHDDIVMSSFFALTDLRENNSNYKAYEV